jgi:hypothetical protein
MQMHYIVNIIAADAGVEIVGKMAQFLDCYCDDFMSVLIYSAATIYFLLDMSTEERLYCSNVTSFYSSV